MRKEFDSICAKLNPAIIELAKAYEAMVDKARAEVIAEAKAELEAQGIAPDCDEYDSYICVALSWFYEDYRPSLGYRDDHTAYFLVEQWECVGEDKAPTVEEFINWSYHNSDLRLALEILTEKFGWIFVE